MFLSTWDMGVVGSVGFLSVLGVGSSKGVVLLKDSQQMTIRNRSNCYIRKLGSSNKLQMQHVDKCPCAQTDYVYTNIQCTVWNMHECTDSINS